MVVSIRVHIPDSAKLYVLKKKKETLLWIALPYPYFFPVPNPPGSALMLR